MTMCNEDGGRVPAPAVMADIMDNFPPVSWWATMDCSDEVYRRVQGWLTWAYTEWPANVWHDVTGADAAGDWLNPRAAGIDRRVWMKAVYELDQRAMKLRQMFTAALLIERWEHQEP